MPFPGPAALGRGVVVGPGQVAPDGFPVDADRVVVGPAVLEDEAAATWVADRLHQAWITRESVVIELTADNAALRAPQVETRQPYELDAGFDLQRQRIHVLTWANTYDARSPGREGEAVWWHGVLAERAGATTGTSTDVVLPDGTEVWIDGGPREPLDVPTVHRESVARGRLTPASYRDPAEDLAPDQLAAVTQPRSAARIIAPAGSGKTRVLTARLRHLLRDRGYEPDAVTALAYNTRAAGEMRERTTDLKAHIRTIHALGLWICGLEGRRRTIDEREVRSLLEPLLTLPRQPNTDPMAPYLEALAEVRLSLRAPDDVEADRDDVDGFADAYPQFASRLDREGLLDFDGMVFHAIEVLLARPDIRDQVQRRCQHLLVDEFQDLTPAFLLLIRLAAGPFAQIFGVGDDDQVLYGYAGATPTYLTDFTTYVPGADAHALEVNYRCPADVVSAASNLLQWNTTRVAKVIHAGPAAVAEGLQVVRVAAEAQASTAVRTVAGWTEDGATADIAVLARVNSALLPVQVALTEAGIGHDAPLSASVLQRTGIRSALAWLRVGTDPERMDQSDVRETLKRPSRKVSRAIEPFLRRRRRWTLDGLAEVADTLGGGQGDRIHEYIADIERLTDTITAGAGVAEVFAHVRDTIGLGAAMDTLDSSKTRPEGSSHADDLTALEQLGVLHPDVTTFTSWLRDALETPATEGGVTLSTVHRVKGMEWDRVVVYGANSGLFPHRLAEDVEEERRILHVAITRCRREVVVVADAEADSLFLAELDRAPAEGERSAVRAPVRAVRTAAARIANASPSVDQTDPVLQGRFERLRTWRGEAARGAGVPAYIVLHDAGLWAIADLLPTTLGELARVPGIGPAKLERYGDDLLEVVEELISSG